LHAIEARHARAAAAGARRARADRRRVRDAQAEAVDLHLLLEALAGRLALDLRALECQVCVERHRTPPSCGIRLTGSGANSDGSPLLRSLARQIAPDARTPPSRPARPAGR